jgi:hypothetical protein
MAVYPMFGRTTTGASEGTLVNGLIPEASARCHASIVDAVGVIGARERCRWGSNPPVHFEKLSEPLALSAVYPSPRVRRNDNECK